MATLGDLLLSLKTRSVWDILDCAKDESERGYLYEALWHMCCVSRVGMGNVLVSKENADRGFFPIVDYVSDFLQRKMRSGASGWSDITMQDVKTKKIIVSSAKYISSTSSYESYEIEKLNTLRLARFPDSETCLFTKSRSVYDRARETYRAKTLTKEVDHIKDLDDLAECLRRLKDVLSKYSWDLSRFAREYLTTGRTFLQLKFHQVLHNKAAARMNPHNDRLAIVKCRGGKSYIIASDILRTNPHVAIIITPIPTETMKDILQVFLMHEDFVLAGYKHIIELKHGVVLPRDGSKMIIVASKQFLDKHLEDAIFDGITFDAKYLDEVHYAGLTPKAQRILRSRCTHSTSILTLTGTGDKPRHMMNIRASQTFFWTLEHETMCREGDLEGLGAEHGEDFWRLLEEYYGPENTKEEYAERLKTSYAKMPILNHTSLTFDKKFLETIKNAKLHDGKVQTLDFTELFKINDKGQLVYLDDIDELLTRFFGRPGVREKTVMDEIRACNSRTGRYGPEYYSGGGGATQLWFLPTGTGVNSISGLLKPRIEQHAFGSHYRVAIVNGESGSLTSKIRFREFIEEEERKAIRDGQRGLIVLLGNMGNMGVSLPRADIVCMFTNTHEWDRYTQMSMRCLTEDVGKKYGFVIDFNQKRVLHHTLTLVHNPLHTKSMREMLSRAVEIVRFGAFDFESHDKTEFINQLQELWMDIESNRPEVVRSRLEHVSGITLSEDMRNRIGMFMRKVDTKCERPQVEKAEIFTEDEKIGDVPAERKEHAIVEDSVAEDEPELIPDFGYEIVTSIPFLVAILTANSPEIDIFALLTQIRNSHVKQASFCRQCEIWWEGSGMDGFIDCLSDIIRESCNLNTINEINLAIDMLKTAIRSKTLLDDKKGLIDMINSMLRPKQLEKKKYGEVYTPLDVVMRLLDQIPASAWSDPTLKWFDPACGIGNFLVDIYYRLMDGLQTRFPDKDERRVHIITKMLYMSDIGPKNVEVCKLIFGETANIYHGDTLKMDTYAVWGVGDHAFQVVGNPPFNDDSNNVGAGHDLWRDFTHTALYKWVRPDGYFAFIHPPGWRKLDDDLFREMRKCQFLYLEIHNVTDGNKIFKCGTAFDMYVLQFCPASRPSKVICENNIRHDIDIRKWRFLPNSMFEEIEQLCNSEETLDVQYHRSSYGHDKVWMSKTKSLTHVHPVVYTIKKDAAPTLFWSSTKDRGHYGVSKFIFSNGSGFLQDPHGEYATTQWSYFIRDEPDTLPKIRKAFENPLFQEVIQAIKLDKSAYNIPVMKLFRKDFWSLYE